MLDSEWVAQEPQPEIMGYGTDIILRMLDTPDGAYQYWRRVRMRSSPVFGVSFEVRITAFVPGQSPAPVDFQPALDETQQRIVYRPRGGGLSHVLAKGVYKVEFVGSEPDAKNYRLEIETEFLPDSWE